MKRETKVRSWLVMCLTAACAAEPELVLVPEEQPLRVRSETCSATVDDFDDGVIDSRWTFEHTAQGRRILAKEVASDGTVLWDYIEELDRAGRTLLYDVGIPLNGPNWRSRSTYVYDTFGRMLRREEVNTSDDTWTTHEEETATAWTATGRVLTSTIETYAVDPSGEAVPYTTLTATYTYDAAGRMTSEERARADGTLHFARRSEYDDVARTRRDTREYNYPTYPPGTDRSRNLTEWVSTFDERGRKLTSQLRYPLASDPSPVQSASYVWDGDRLASYHVIIPDWGESTTVYSPCGS